MLDAAARPGVPVCLVTGFLGAGKTTLLNHVLRNRRGLRAAVFVNEFGAMDIDGNLIRWQGAIDEARVVTLDNGCICCEVNADLAKQLSHVLRRSSEDGAKVDFVIIETSGVCDPEPVLATLGQMDDLAISLHLDSVLAVVDAQTLGEGLRVGGAEALGLEETARKQICHGDIVLLNKCDLLGGLGSQPVCSVEERLRSEFGDGQMPRVIRTERAEVDLELITCLAPDPAPVAEPDVGVEFASDEQQCGSARKRQRTSEDEKDKASPVSLAKEYGRGRHEKGSLRAKASSFNYTADRPFDPLKFEAWVEAGPPSSICRAKGLLWVKGVPRHVIFQLAGSRTNPFETVAGGGSPSGSQIVFIGEVEKLKAGDESAVKQALDSCLA